MKILLITQDFFPRAGGITVFLHNLCLHLCYLGHRVDVLTPYIIGCHEFDIQQPYSVYRYSISRRMSSLIPLYKTLFLYNRYRYDVIFLGHFMSTHALGALLLRKICRVPYVFLTHGNDLNYSIKTWLDQVVAGKLHWLIGNAAQMLGNSHFTAKRIRQIGYEGPINVLNPGVDTRQFRPGLDTASIKREYGLNGHRVLLTTARLVARKNIDSVLRALPRVIEQVPNIIYMIAGEGEERGRLVALCKDLGLQSYVRFLGYVKDELLPFLYCVSDIFIMPSYALDGGRDYEGFGISFMEASACGLPVIGGRAGGTADAIIDGETGILVDPHNIDEIAGAILRLLNDKVYARRLGENGRKRVVQEFGWEKVSKRLESILTEITE